MILILNIKIYDLHCISSMIAVSYFCYLLKFIPKVTFDQQHLIMFISWQTTHHHSSIATGFFKNQIKRMISNYMNPLGGRQHMTSSAQSLINLLAMRLLIMTMNGAWYLMMCSSRCIHSHPTLTNKSWISRHFLYILSSLAWSCGLTNCDAVLQHGHHTNNIHS